MTICIPSNHRPIKNMRRLLLPIFSLLISILLISCATTQPPETSVPKILASTLKNGKGVPNGRSDSGEAFAKLSGIANDSSYGFSVENPIKVGNGNFRAGSRNEKLYLNALRGSAGEPVEFERLGSCCHFSTPNGLQGGGLIDIFRIYVSGNEKPITLYLNMYDPGLPVVPQGFSIRTTQ